jgi:hypothetical protein
VTKPKTPGPINVLVSQIDYSCTQSRHGINPGIVAEYAAAYRDGKKLPPLEVFYDDTVYWLADGFHRLFAAKDEKMERVWCNVHRGNQRDALLASVGANDEHGLRRSKDDRLHAVRLMFADPEWSTWSDRAICEACKVHHEIVEEVRAELANEHECALRALAPQESPQNEPCENSQGAENDPTPTSDGMEEWIAESTSEEPPAAEPESEPEPTPEPKKRKGRDGHLRPASGKNGGRNTSRAKLIQKGLTAWRALADCLEKLEIFDLNREQMEIIHAALKMEEDEKDAA